MAVPREFPLTRPADEAWHRADQAAVPHRRGSGNRWRRIGPTLAVVAGFVGAVGILTGATYCIGRHCESFLQLSATPDGSEATAAIPMEYALTSAEYNDVVFLGDSAPLYDIDPIAFEKQTELKAYNLASFRPVSINGFLLTAQAYLAHHPAPRVIVLCISPEVPGGTDFERVFAKRFVRVYGSQIAGKHPAVAEIVQAIVREDDAVVLIKRGASIVRDHLAYWLEWTRHDVRDDVLIGSANETYNTFAKRLSETRGHIKPTELHGPPNKPGYAGKRFTVQPEWDRAIRALISLTDRTGARLVIRFAPARKDAAAENFDEVVGSLRNLQSEFPQISVDPTIQYYDSELCFDLWHLNAVGAERYTRCLADDLGSLLGKKVPKPDQMPAARRTP
jgi:hypothetical protein